MIGICRPRLGYELAIFTIYTVIGVQCRVCVQSLSVVVEWLLSPPELRSTFLNFRWVITDYRVRLMFG